MFKLFSSCSTKFNSLGMDMQHRIFPNFSEIQLAEKEVSIYESEYSDDLFRECKAEDDGYFYYRDGRSLFAIPEKSGLTRPLGFQNVSIEIDSNPQLTAKILDIAFKSFFAHKGRKVYHRKYSSTSGFEIETEAPVNLGLLKLIPSCEYSVHPIIKENQVVYVMTLSKEYKPRFDQMVKKYIDSGVDIRDWETRGGKIVASRGNIKKYLERTNQQKKYDTELARLTNKEKEYEFIGRAFGYINRNLSEIPCLLLTVSSLSHLMIPNVNAEQASISKPVLYYYNKNTMRGMTDVALKDLKPMSYDLFSNKPVSICIFIPKSDAKQCERFIDKVKASLDEIFHLYKVIIKLFYVGEDRREHLKIISEFDNRQYDLALIFLYHRDKFQQSSRSAYNRLKAKLISKQIPSQSVLVENARIGSIYTVKNLSLNLYSKLGGTPWAVEKNSFIGNEFVIGVGSTISSEGVRNIGFASVFDHFGSYIVGSCSSLCKIEDYREELRSYLCSILSEIISSRAISEGERIRLVFHVFKPASKRYEIAAINRCLEEFSDYEIDFAIVNINYSHPFKLFKNVSDNLDRGCFIKFNDHHAFLCMGGVTSKPLQIKLDRRSTYKDIFELAKQILYFSHLSHRSFKPANNPVTTVYPQRLAKLTSDLLTIEHWDVDMLHGMKDKLWFI